MHYIKKFFPFLIVIILLFLIKNNISAIFDALSVTNTTKNLKAELSKKEKENQYLNERLKYVKSDRFIEEQAQEKLGLLRPGELFVIAPNVVPLDEKSNLSDDRPNWQRWLELFF